MRMQNQHDRKRIKIVFLGDRGVGKSSIITRFITNQFEQNIEPTIGIDFMGKNVKYKNQNYRIELWDTAGQEKYRSLVKGYLKTANACVFVYDCTNIHSLINIPEWLKLFDEVCSREAYRIMVGNKCDREHNENTLRSVKEHLGQRTMEQLMSSAKIGLNIQKIFEKILQNDLSGGKKEQSLMRIKVQKIKQMYIKKCCHD